MQEKFHAQGLPKGQVHTMDRRSSSYALQKQALLRYKGSHWNCFFWSEKGVQDQN